MTRWLPHASSGEYHDSMREPLVDDAAWIRVGRELKRLDPERYERVLRVAQDMVDAYLDPLGAVGRVATDPGKPSTSDLD